MAIASPVSPQGLACPLLPWCGKRIQQRMLVLGEMQAQGDSSRTLSPPLVHGLLPLQSNTGVKPQNGDS